MDNCTPFPSANENSSSSGPAQARRRLVALSPHVRAALVQPNLADAAASDERIVELWLRDRPANTRIAYERDYRRFRAFIGVRSLGRSGSVISRILPLRSAARPPPGVERSPRSKRS